jgi:hypothetical protein
MATFMGRLLKAVRVATASVQSNVRNSTPVIVLTVGGACGASWLLLVSDRHSWRPELFRPVLANTAMYLEQNVQERIDAERRRLRVSHQ